MSRIFLSFRKIDDRAGRERIYEALKGRYGAEQVFKSGESIPAGVDYVRVLLTQAAACEAMVVLIGPGWVDAAVGDGVRALDREDDWVRREIATALASGNRVVPVLVGDGTMLPTAAQLPEDIAAMATLQALRIEDSAFETGLARLIDTLDRQLPGLAKSGPPDADPPEAGPPAAGPGQSATVSGGVSIMGGRDVDASGATIVGGNYDHKVTNNRITNKKGGEAVGFAGVVATLLRYPPIAKAAAWARLHPAIASISAVVLLGAATGGIVAGVSGGGGPAASGSQDQQPISVSVPTTDSVTIPPVATTVALGPAAWSAAVPVAHGKLLSTSCAGADFCAAVDETGNAYIFNGTAWSAQTSLNNGRTLNSVSCVSPAFCVAVGASGSDDTAGNGDAFFYNGTSWSSAEQIGSRRPPVAVDCRNQTFCMAVDGYGSASLFDGQTWSNDTDTAGDYIYAVACPSTDLCFGPEADYIDSGVLTYNGSTWGSTVTPVANTSGLAAISCPSPTFCAAVGPNLGSATWNGTTWTAPAEDPFTQSGLDAVSCASSTFCLALGPGGISETYNGSTWAAGKKMGDGSDEPTAVSCSSASFCVAVGTSGDAYIFAPPGAGPDIRSGNTSTAAGAWSAPKSVGNVSVDSLSCPSTTFCLAVGQGVAYPYDGTSWGKPLILGDEGLDVVSCASAALCMTENGEDALIIQGSHVTSYDTENNQLNNVDCAPDGTCLFGSGAVTPLRYSSGAWTHPFFHDQLGSEVDQIVSCTSATFCAAVVGHDFAVYKGSTWNTAATGVAEYDGQQSLSCGSPSFCLLTEAGNAYVYSNGSMSAATNFAGAHTIVSLSCPTATFCMAIDNSNESYVFDGTSWSTAIPIGLADSANIEQVSCPAAGLCVAIDNADNSYVFTG